MDLDRLRDEALRPAYEGQPVQYRAYSCREGAYLPARELAAQPLVILEGSYSHHPLLTGCETLRVFLTCAKEEQTRRLQAREGERYANFAARCKGTVTQVYTVGRNVQPKPNEEVYSLYGKKYVIR